MMNRNQRAAVARETVTICDIGGYTSPRGVRVDISESLRQAKGGTVLYGPDNPPVVPPSSRMASTRIEVKNETTFEALARLAGAGSGHHACLNFASAKKPGGGFLNGSLAQEEALACASGLYPCLLLAPEYYERNRSGHSALYLDLAIFSPGVPFFRDDEGRLIDAPLCASIITAPAPNAGAIAQNEPANASHVESTLRRRAGLVLDIAVTHHVERLVLGAWGCGVFRNDPRTVAGIFARLLQSSHAGRFEEVVFAVFDRTVNHTTYRAFVAAFEKE